MMPQLKFSGARSRLGGHELTLCLLSLMLAPTAAMPPCLGGRPWIRQPTC